MVATKSDENLSHEIRQPLNIISLAVANLRARIAPLLSDDDARYLEEKLARIERQVERSSELLDQLGG